MIGNSWDKYLGAEFEQDYFKELQEFLTEERKTQKIYPSYNKVFNAFKLTPFESVKVVIIGQDPYHGEGQAHGLSFSVEDPNLKIPPSLKNIYKEMKSDLGLETPEHANLSYWAKQGVLLLNNVLTVREKEPGSHRKKGWEQFTDKVIESLNTKKNNLVFILWGNDAKSKAKSVDKSKHLVLESAHPSPFSVKNFLGNQHFSKANNYLSARKIKQIDWRL